MASAPSKLYADDVSLLVVLLDTNPFFWSTSSLPFSKFLSHVLAFLNSILVLNQLNEVVVIGTGYASCKYLYNSSSYSNHGLEDGRMPALCTRLLKNLEEFVIGDEQSIKEDPKGGTMSSLLSGSLSMALCYIQKVFRSGSLHPQPRILCLQGSPDGPEQYVAIMNAIFSAQRSMVSIDSCYIGSHNSAFLQQASYITGGVYLKPQQMDGLFQYLATVFGTDLHSRTFLQLPKSVGVDFRASNCSIFLPFLEAVGKWNSFGSLGTNGDDLNETVAERVNLNIVQFISIVVEFGGDNMERWLARSRIIPV
ncbi:RNA polymerase II transcription factor B subunit 4 [Cucumis melo var. makuwa]|uniref:General transcription and DNA repair factor IIH subunit TFB4 n=1 Tax=Cucumis melo var. makuwa TaxID=1194695 RepID=A0A5A7U2L2_CUCMM|nr:RNA polymerase II transcription factor B subunit 4 [Cucumis melo var. makuwa]TYK08324.1 RNA polymerase II transcription factor B subunit 4 [Cucumis melo var. makuwa]